MGGIIFTVGSGLKHDGRLANYLSPHQLRQSNESSSGNFKHERKLLKSSAHVWKNPISLQPHINIICISIYLWLV
jgi:hypothetical protein